MTIDISCETARNDITYQNDFGIVYDTSSFLSNTVEARSLPLNISLTKSQFLSGTTSSYTTGNISFQAGDEVSFALELQNNTSLAIT